MDTRTGRNREGTGPGRVEFSEPSRIQDAAVPLLRALPHKLDFYFPAPYWRGIDKADGVSGSAIGHGQLAGWLDFDQFSRQLRLVLKIILSQSTKLGPGVYGAAIKRTTNCFSATAGAAANLAAVKLPSCITPLLPPLSKFQLRLPIFRPPAPL